MEILYKELKREEIEFFDHIDRKEVMTHSYKVEDGALVKVEDYYDNQGWSQPTRNKLKRRLVEVWDNGGVIIGAFYETTCVGIASLGYRWMGDGKQLNLDGLWVSHDYRKKGIATTLVDMIIKVAKSKGATSLYVSATETDNTVHFYQHRGFVMTQDPDKILFEKEPNDIHMVLAF